MTPQSTSALNDQVQPLTPHHGEWATYVRAPDNDRVTPPVVHSVSGGVEGPRPGDPFTGAFTLHRRAGDPEPSIVLDYGVNVAGVPWFDVTASASAATIRASFSESAFWADADGDLEGSHNESGNRQRVELHTIDGAGIYTTGRIQGGQRYERIALTSPGSVTFAAIGVQFSAFRATPDDYRGWFLSSSDLLNRIWYEGAYTVQLNQLPAGTLPAPWTILDGHLDADGGTVGFLADRTWSDFIMTFQANILEGAASWIIRVSQDGTSGHLVTLRPASSAAAPEWVVELATFDDGIDDRDQDLDRRIFPVASQKITLPPSIDGWHTIQTTAAGIALSITIDGVKVLDFDITDHGDATLAASGVVGFRVAWLDHIQLRDLTITSTVDDNQYSNAFGDPESLAGFRGPAIGTPDPLPVIIDGGKRDRTVWSGDLLVQAPNVFYTTWQEPYVRGSIELLNGYQEPTGQSAARVPPIMPPAVAPRSGQTYSAVYSMHQVTNVALHYLYTGDLDFLRTQWPSVTRELAYDATLLDDRGLIVMDAADALDWDWYDGPKLGAVTAYNVSYFIALTHAAGLANALGLDEDGADLTTRAAQLREVVNEHLYDSDRHLYMLSDLAPESVAQDGNCLAVLSGLVPDKDGAAVMHALADVLPQTPYGPSPFTPDTGFWEAVSPYVGDMHLRALFTVGHTDAAFDLLTRQWGYMVDSGVHAAGTAWELIGTDGTPGFGAKTSLAHGWGAGATTALSAFVLGVTPTSPSYSIWSFAPQLGDLTWAEGTVPTPYGPIDADWKRSEDTLTMTLSAPQKTSGRIVVPILGTTTTVELRGTTQAGAHVHQTIARENGQKTVVPIDAGGTYRLDVR